MFGAKLMFNQLDELHALASHLPEFSSLETGALLERLFGGPRYIWVSRRDVARQAVSMWKAIQTRTWREGDGDGSVTPRYRFDAIDHLVRRFQDDERGWESFFSSHGIEPLRIAYEDELVADRDAAVRRALDWLGVNPPSGWRAEEPLRRQADTDSDDWVAAYHRDRSARGLDRPPVDLV